MRYTARPSILKDIKKDLMFWLDDVYFGRFRAVSTQEVSYEAMSTDPDDPADGMSVMWQSDGTGSGDVGDIMMKITVSSTTKTTTLVDYSAV